MHAMLYHWPAACTGCNALFPRCKDTHFKTICKDTVAEMPTTYVRLFSRVSRKSTCRRCGRRRPDLTKTAPLSHKSGSTRSTSVTAMTLRCASTPATCPCDIYRVCGLRITPYGGVEANARPQKLKITVGFPCSQAPCHYGIRCCNVS